MTLSTPVLFAAYTVFSVAGMLIVKRVAPALKSAWASGESVIQPALLVGTGAGLYVLGFSLWMIILARTPLTVAYPVAVGLTMVFSFVGAVVVLGESLSWQAILGSLLVFAGIALLARA
ncbi:hypothetical protein [Cognatilysobacter bugurensis]|uniref:EamA domain-containing protein n=1 Tax=Cognatilysobacter bugurensis TaxID=543356 RepID=A0A918WAJ5_9GAMM|nr:hypothetical protein [Lysobacter bugurensis]GHA85608.1 hypothetical protein GCM10007067_24570 [Lysobacter bugurensis]